MGTIMSYPHCREAAMPLDWDRSGLSSLRWDVILPLTINDPCPTTHAGPSINLPPVSPPPCWCVEDMGPPPHPAAATLKVVVFPFGTFTFFGTLGGFLSNKKTPFPFFFYGVSPQTTRKPALLLPLLQRIIVMPPSIIGRGHASQRGHVTITPQYYPVERPTVHTVAAARGDIPRPKLHTDL